MGMIIIKNYSMPHNCYACDLHNYHECDLTGESIEEDYCWNGDKREKHCPLREVEVISKDQYEQRLKSDMVAMLTDIQLEIEKLPFDDEEPVNITQEYMDEVKSWEYGKKDCVKIIQEKINNLQVNNSGVKRE